MTKTSCYADLTSRMPRRFFSPAVAAILAVRTFGCRRTGSRSGSRGVPTVRRWNAATGSLFTRIEGSFPARYFSPSVNLTKETPPAAPGQVSHLQPCHAARNHVRNGTINIVPACRFEKVIMRTCKRRADHLVPRLAPRGNRRREYGDSADRGG